MQRRGRKRRRLKREKRHYDLSMSWLYLLFYKDQRCDYYLGRFSMEIRVVTHHKFLLVNLFVLIVTWLFA